MCQIIWIHGTSYLRRLLIVVTKIIEESLYESRVANHSNKYSSTVRRNLTTDNLCTVYPIMRAVAFDPSGLQGLLFDLTLIDTLGRPSKDKTFCQYPLRRGTLLKKSDLGVIVKRNARSKGPRLLNSGIVPGPHVHFVGIFHSGIFPCSLVTNLLKAE